MKKIALTTAALFIAVGSAYAGSGRSIVTPGHDANAPFIDQTTTSSISKDLLGSSATPQDPNPAGQAAVNQGQFGQGIWGGR